MTAVPVQFIGIDPGPIPGIVLLRGATSHVVQCSASLAPAVLHALLEYDVGCPAVVQIEAFVPGRKARAAGQASAATRDLIGQLRQIWEDFDSTSDGRLGGHWFQRSAGEVKPWATDERLEAAGLLEATRGMRHAKDAARHALFCAVRDGGIPDPLSKRSNR